MTWSTRCGASLGFRQIGHLGTLDPLATGVLVLLLGRATRLAQFYAGAASATTRTFRFGFATDTYDADGTPLGPDTAPLLDRAEIERLAPRASAAFRKCLRPIPRKKFTAVRRMNWRARRNLWN